MVAVAHDFSYQNLNGRSFAGRDLSGANFKGTRLIGTQFRGATLVGACFDGARAGSSRVVIVVLVALLVLVGLNVGITGLTSATVFQAEHVAHAGPAEGVLVYALLLLFTGCLFLHGPGLALLSSILFVMIGWIGFLVAESIWLGGAAEVLYSDRHTLSIAIGTTGIAMWAGLLTNVFVGGWLLASLRGKCGWIGATSVWWLHRQEVLLILAAALGMLPGLLGMPGALAKGSAAVISLVRVICIVYLARQVVAEHPRFDWLQPMTRAAIAWGSTSFRGANLRDASFAAACLQSTDFLDATLSRTDFHQAKGLDFVRFGQTILRDRSVRQLLTTRSGHGQTLRGADFSFAQLTGADLTGADLTNASLTGADCTEVCLEHADLSRVSALGTCFESSLFTGACVEAWNIDSATRLEGIRCSHVYLLSDCQERRPSQGDFEPDEFTRLFQEVLHTVDLIFRNGLDFSALLSAFKQVQIEHPDTPLAIRSIENKGDGMVLVRVDAPTEVDKAQIHAELSEEYDSALKAIEARYQAELAAKDEQINIYRQHQTALMELTQLLTPAKAPAAVGKRVVLKTMEPARLPAQSGSGTCQVMLQIGLEGALPHVEVIGELPDFSAIADHYSQWKQAYSQIIHCLGTPRIQAPTSQVTNVSFQEILLPCQQAARQLKLAINQWLDSPVFRPLKEQLLEQLQPTDSIRFFWQTSDPLLRQLPLQMWRWFDRYSKAELVVAGATYRHQHSVGQSPNEIRILSILGDRTGLDVTTDKSLLAALPDVSLTLLDGPSSQQVTDQLWDSPWDILFFAGHSQQADHKTQPGQIRLNAHDCLSLEDLKYGLRKATERGLKLAIFNTCDGLSLLRNLTDVPTPPLVVMRHPVPDQVAQAFLKNLLVAFSEGLPLHQAVREAREKLQGLESQFPFATWLPVICQSPASHPLSWQDLYVE